MCDCFQKMITHHEYPQFASSPSTMPSEREREEGLGQCTTRQQDHKNYFLPLRVQECTSLLVDVQLVEEVDIFDHCS